jgi:uncharacterized protein YqeY
VAAQAPLAVEGLVVEVVHNAGLAPARCSPRFPPPKEAARAVVAGKNDAATAASAARASKSGMRRDIATLPSASAKARLRAGVRTRGLQSRHMSVADSVKQDLTIAMKAREKERVGALRLVLSELQKAAKDGNDDELAILRRERKRRLESAAAFRDAGRVELAEGEEAEAAVIEAYLPAELGDDELRQIVTDAIAESGATTPKDLGAVMKIAMERTGGRADGKRVSALAREALT